MHYHAAILLTSTPIVAAMIQSNIPAGHEATSYWVSYGSFAIMAWAAWSMLKKAQALAAEEREASEKRMEKLIEQVLANEARGYDVIADNSEKLGELTGVIRRCSGQPRAIPTQYAGQPPAENSR